MGTNPEEIESGTMYNKVKDDNATTLEISTGTDTYLYVFYWTNADTLTEETIRNSIQIKEKCIVDLKSKNLFNYKEYPVSTTRNGVTITNNGDGSFTLNGTSTANNTQFILGDESIVKQLVNAGDVVQTAYYISGTCTKVSTSNARTIIRLNYDTGSNKMIPLQNLETQKIISVLNPKDTREEGWSWRIVLDSGDSFNNFTIKYQLEEGSTPTAFEQYYNYELAGIKSKNLLNLKNGTYTGNNVTATVNNGIITLNGSNTSSSTIFLNIPLDSNIEWITNESYTISLNNSATSDGIKFRVNSAGGKDVALTGTNATSTIVINVDDMFNDRIVLRITSGTSFENFAIKPQIEKCSTASSYMPYYNYTDTIFTREGKWYKGSKVSKVILDGTEIVPDSSDSAWTYYTSTNKPVFYMRAEVLNYKIETGLLCFCDYFKGYGQVYSFNNVYDLGNYAIALRTQYERLVIRFDSKTTLSSFKEWLGLNNITVYYVLDTPTEEEITAPGLISQLNTLYNAL